MGKAVCGRGAGRQSSRKELTMATATTAEISKVVRQVLDEELGDDSEVMSRFGKAEVSTRIRLTARKYFGPSGIRPLLPTRIWLFIRSRLSLE